MNCESRPSDDTTVAAKARLDHWIRYVQKGKSGETVVRCQSRQKQPQRDLAVGTLPSARRTKFANYQLAMAS